MEDILKVLIVISLSGILLLLFLSNILEPKLIDIEKINNRMVNRKVKISGTVIEIYDKETFKILIVKDKTGKINVLCKCRDIKNESIEVIGRVKKYKNQLQINADKILKIK